MRRGQRGAGSTLKTHLSRVLAVMFLTAALAAAAGFDRDVFVLTSTNKTTNDVVVFKLETGGTPSLSLVSMLPTGGTGRDFTRHRRRVL